MSGPIVVPLDGSDFSEEAIAPAVSLAKARGARLQLVSVQFAHPYLSYTPAEAAALRARIEQAAARAEALLGAAVHLVVLHNPLQSVLQHRSPAEAVAASVCAHAAGSGADLIVVSTHGRGALLRMLLGSVADQLVRRSTVPLLLVRPRLRPRQLTAVNVPAFRHVMIALDGSEDAAAAIEPALALFGTARVSYTLAKAVTPPADPVGPGGLSAVEHWRRDALAAREAARAYLEGVAAFMRRTYSATTFTEVVFATDPEAIAEVIGLTNADVVVIASRGRAGFDRLIHGSLAARLLHAARVPLLIVGPRMTATSRSARRERAVHATHATEA